jgi:hypothetical protein
MRPIHPLAAAPASSQNEQYDGCTMKRMNQSQQQQRQQQQHQQQQQEAVTDESTLLGSPFSVSNLAGSVDGNSEFHASSESSNHNPHHHPDHHPDRSSDRIWLKDGMLDSISSDLLESIADTHQDIL